MKILHHILKVIIFIGFFLGTFHFVEAATLSISPSSGSYGVGQTFTAKILVNPEGGEQLNAVESQLTFDQTRLTISSVTKDGSVFSLWTTEPEFSNSAGTINFGGGSPTPFSQSSTLINVTFRTLKEGTAEVAFESGSVLAADGKGTDVLSGTVKSSYVITGAPVPTDDERPPVGDLPPAPKITSDTHPDEDVWYAETSAKFSWELPRGVNAVRLLFSEAALDVPTVSYSPPLIVREIEDVEDGIWYFHAQFRNGSGWGETTHRRVLIDTTPPEPFEIEVVPGASTTTLPKLRFESFDETSGILHYEILFGNEEPVILLATEMSSTTEGWEVPGLPDGSYLAIVKAVDNAGNNTSSEVEVILTAGILPPTSTSAQPTDEGGGFSLLWLVIIVLIIIIILLVALLWYQRKNIEKEHIILRRETKEIRDKMEKIFSVLQDELEEQVRNLDGKPRLSKSEKLVLESLREALEISEAFINKEIEDVEKILR